LNTKSTPEGQSTVDGLLNEMVALSRRFGEDPEFTRGGGGNISVKADGILYIKPSGTSLSTLTPQSVIALDVRPLLELLDASPERPVGGGTDLVMQVAIEARVGVRDDRRPSVETLFHALLPERFILHTHPTTVNAVACATHGAEIAERLFGSSVLWVRYTDPGLPLARAIRDARRSHEERTGKAAPPAIFLQNHGLIVAADSTAEIDDISARWSPRSRPTWRSCRLSRGVTSKGSRPSRPGPRWARSVRRCGRCSRRGAGSRSCRSTTRRSRSRWRVRRWVGNSPSSAR